MCRDESGELLSAPPLIREISKDPILSRCKLISEPWDIGSYQVGSNYKIAGAITDRNSWSSVQNRWDLFQTGMFGPSGTDDIATMLGGSYEAEDARESLRLGYLVMFGPLIRTEETCHTVFICGTAFEIDVQGLPICTKSIIEKFFTASIL